MEVTASHALPGADRAEEVGRLSGRCLHEIFAARAEEHPERTAVSAFDGELTYAELDRQATRLAVRLAQAGAAPGAVVATYLDRGINLIVGILGVLKAGAAYLPIDPTLPAERVSWLVTDSAAPFVVTTSDLAAGLASSAIRTLLMDYDSDTAADSAALPVSRDTDLAYVIYTSGSTGRPKGVRVGHRNVVELLAAVQPLFEFSEHDVWTMFHSVAFDFSVWEIWGALSHGGQVIVVPYEVSRAPVRFRALLRERGVTVLNQTPSAFRQLVVADAADSSLDLPALRLVVLGGERLAVELVAPWLARRGEEHPRLVNMYGITETTVHASHRRIRHADLATPAISPIGVPLPHLTFFVLDEQGQAVPDGVAGELYVGGSGVTRGYLNRPDLTAERFRAQPTVGDQRLYRTGDRVLRLPDGQYSYLGRTDDQLKVRGFRIEPGEIETVLRAHPEVRESVVKAHNFGEDDIRLVGYIVPTTASANQREWHDRVQQELAASAAATLPDYMRPSTYVIIQELPLTVNGKIDHAALPPPAPAQSEANGTTTDQGLTPTEAQIAQIWRTTLDVPAVGAHDDFFELGGTSLTLIRMFARVNQFFETDIDITVLVEGATVALISTHIDTAVPAATDREK
ncbi:MAG TPA: amino acid adenylation domain-containing protein [Pseudonocardiaceae bacterium]|nr:amino acid adenylation domain-containing protein [Pseudonocardiaceae bacterium]